MMHVDWLQSALDELTAIWTRADKAGRKAITAASNEIDQRLRRDPWKQGESRSGGRRILFVRLLIVDYRIEPDGRTVTVLGVREVRRRTP